MRTIVIVDKLQEKGMYLTLILTNLCTLSLSRSDEKSQEHLNNRKFAREGYLGGSVVEHLHLVQAIILRSWDRVPHWASCREPASPSAYVSASLSLSLMNKLIKYLKKRLYSQKM